LGPDTGFDVISDWLVAVNLSGFLDRLDRDDELSKLILHSVNAADDDIIAAIIGTFLGEYPGKLSSVRVGGTTIKKMGCRSR
jgi:glucuronate isomerase